MRTNLLDEDVQQAGVVELGEPLGDLVGVAATRRGVHDIYIVYMVQYVYIYIRYMLYICNLVGVAARRRREAQGHSVQQGTKL